MQIIITGSLAFDQIMDFPGKFSEHILPEKIHQINLSFLVNKLTKQRGGTAGNIAYNLALLGMKPIILATAGNDFSEYKKSLEDVGVDTTMIRIMKAEPTASAYIFTDQADNQITGFYPGAMKSAATLSLQGSTLTQGGTLTEKPFVVISPNDPVAMMNFVKECRELNLDYMFDPGMQLPRLSDQDLRLGIEGAKIVIGNDYEMALIRKRMFPRHPEFIRRKALLISGSVSNKKRMLNQVQHDVRQNQLWITTLGEKGAEINTIRIPPAKPKAVLDPTGAGDAFRAGFLSGFLSGQPLDVCGKIGSVAAVYTVEKYGTQTHKFTKKEFQKRYCENFGRHPERTEMSRGIQLSA